VETPVRKGIPNKSEQNKKEGGEKFRRLSLWIEYKLALVRGGGTEREPPRESANQKEGGKKKNLGVCLNVVGTDGRARLGGSLGKTKTTGREEETEGKKRDYH